MIASRVNRGEFPRVIDLMRRGMVQPQLLITGRMPISQAADAYELVEHHKDEHVKIVLEPGA